MRRVGGILASICALTCLEGRAADFCVASVADLEIAMDAINAGGPDSHQVRIVAGDYPIDYVGLYSGGSLTLEGGYNPGCVARSAGAASTVLHAASVGAYDVSFHAFGGNLVISDLTLQDYVVVFLFPQGSAGTNYSLSVSRTAIFLRPSDSSTVEVHTTDSTTTLQNVLIEGTTLGCALTVGPVSGNFELDFVTVVNRGDGMAACANPFNGGVSVKNSIFYAVHNTDLKTSVAIQAWASVFEELDGELDPVSIGNLPGPVVFEVSLDRFERNRPADIVDQPARDSGIAIADVNIDILGDPRISGTLPDRGAFEISAHCDVIMWNGFDDLGPCVSRGHSHHERPACLPLPVNCAP